MSRTAWGGGGGGGGGVAGFVFLEGGMLYKVDQQQRNINIILAKKYQHFLN